MPVHYKDSTNLESTRLRRTSLFTAMLTVGFTTSITSIKFVEMIKFVRMVEIGRTIKLFRNHHLLDSTSNEFEFPSIIDGTIP